MILIKRSCAIGRENIVSVRSILVSFECRNQPTSTSKADILREKSPCVPYCKETLHKQELICPNPKPTTQPSLRRYRSNPNVATNHSGTQAKRRTSPRPSKIAYTSQ